MVGLTLGRYELLEALGRGGSSSVYRARDEASGREVAVKVLGRKVDRSAVKRFRSEASILSRLDHPNIVHVHEVGEHEDYLYYALDLVPGKDLAHLIAEARAAGGRLAAGVVLGVTRDLLAALRYLGQRDLFHRDIKPANVLLDGDGRAHLADFGLARFRDLTRMTQDGQTLGTLRYMSPEQFRGEEVDHRSDLYQLGLILYEMVYGDLPFGGDNPYAQASRRAREPLPLAPLEDQALPPGLVEVMGLACAVRREDRFPDAAAMEGALVRALDPAAGGARRTSGTAPAAKPQFAIVALAVTAGALVGWLGLRDRPASPPASPPAAAPGSSAPFGNAAGLRFVWIPPGSFIMGMGPDEPKPDHTAKPPHEVRLTRGFWMSATEVTQGAWAAVVGTTPSSVADAGRPVEQITWYDCQVFCRRLTDLERGAGRLPAGFVYRLPTEAEWEYACRAGTITPLYSGSMAFPPRGQVPALEPIAWYRGNSGPKSPLAEAVGTRPVGGKLPNPWGLYDMLGNVLEWCHDGGREYTSERVTDPVGPTVGVRVLRGGSFRSGSDWCRSAARGDRPPEYRKDDVGCRVVVAPPAPGTS